METRIDDRIRDKFRREPKRGCKRCQKERYRGADEVVDSLAALASDTNAESFSSQRSQRTA